MINIFKAYTPKKYLISFNLSNGLIHFNSISRFCSSHSTKKSLEKHHFTIYVRMWANIPTNCTRKRHQRRVSINYIRFKNFANVPSVMDSPMKGTTASTRSPAIHDKLNYNIQNYKWTTPSNKHVKNYY